MDTEKVIEKILEKIAVNLNPFKEAWKHRHQVQRLASKRVSKMIKNEQKPTYQLLKATDKSVYGTNVGPEVSEKVWKKRREVADLFRKRYNYPMGDTPYNYHNLSSKRMVGEEFIHESKGQIGRDKVRSKEYYKNNK